MLFLLMGTDNYSFTVRLSRPTGGIFIMHFKPLILYMFAPKLKHIFFPYILSAKCCLIEFYFIYNNKVNFNLLKHKIGFLGSDIYLIEVLIL